MLQQHHWFLRPANSDRAHSPSPLFRTEHLRQHSGSAVVAAARDPLKKLTRSFVQHLLNSLWAEWLHLLAAAFRSSVVGSGDGIGHACLFSLKYSTALDAERGRKGRTALRKSLESP